MQNWTGGVRKNTGYKKVDEETPDALADTRLGKIMNVRKKITEPLLLDLVHIGGVIDNKDIMQFKRFIIRATRCKVAVDTWDLHIHREDYIHGDNYHVGKSIFLLSFQKNRDIESVLERKVRRICSNFPGEIFEININEINDKYKNALDEKTEFREIIRRTKQDLKNQLLERNNEHRDVS